MSFWSWKKSPGNERQVASRWTTPVVVSTVGFIVCAGSPDPFDGRPGSPGKLSAATGSGASGSAAES